MHQPVVRWTQIASPGNHWCYGPPVQDASFETEIEPFRRELLAHCYRMLGALHDAEDAYQETLVRAWRGRDRFEGKASLRTWLHRIATNVCLDAIGDRKGRVMRQGPPHPPDAPLPAPVTDPIWLDPIPDTWIDDRECTPDARYLARESVTIAFMTALQVLPARQRAVLLLRDVVGLSAEETGAALDMTVAAVNSALQRARAALDDAGPRRAPAPIDAIGAALLSRYVRALESADWSELLAILRDDAVWAMPPMPVWIDGAPAIAAFHARVLGGTANRLVATTANGAPAFAVYQDGQLTALGVLDLDRDRIAAIHTFLTGPGAPLPRVFGLVDALPA